MRDFVTQLGGKPYAIRFVPVDRLGTDTFGQCVKDDGEILIADDLTGHRLADTLIHECLHACLDMLAEDTVENTASEIARTLRKAGLI